MKTESQPLVSVVTPVYNGAEFLAECIESVLAQTYANWDYTIVDNCSTDESLAIAQKFADQDPRIRVVKNDRFLNILENHNHTARRISLQSKYCKFVFADDRLYPNCLEEMVRVAERNSSIGLVGAYTTDGRAVRWHGPPFPSEWISGKEVCRNQLRGGPYVFGTLTSLLVRSDLIRKRPALFSQKHLQADMEACFELMQESDFAFIHQVLSFSRERAQATDSLASNLNSHRLADYIVFLRYGPKLLGKDEYEKRLKIMRRQYHRVLAHNVLRLRPKQFWKYHQEILAAYDTRIDRWLLGASVIAELATLLAHPVRAFRRAMHWWSPGVRRADNKRVERYRQASPAGDSHE
jgi:glycosyltransferase involved in cell wall biosynthesis